MKKSIIIMLGLALMSVQSFADTRAQALLLHNGQGKSFDANQLQEAVNEAVDGDTIYLSEGTFVTGKNNDDTLIVEKAVSIIGTGETTKLAGYVNIAIDGNPISNGLEFGRMHITKDLLVIKKMHGLKVSQCFIDGYFTATDTITGIKMDRCFARTFTPTQYIRSATVTNSIFTCIGSFYNDPKKAVNESLTSKEQVVDIAKTAYMNMGYDVDNMPIILDLFILISPSAQIAPP